MENVTVDTDYENPPQRNPPTLSACERDFLPFGLPSLFRLISFPPSSFVEPPSFVDLNDNKFVIDYRLVV